MVSKNKRVKALSPSTDNVKSKGKVTKRRMTFAERKPKALAWIKDYDGKAYNGNIIKAYRKKFALDRLTAVHELELLGVNITLEHLAKEIAAVNHRKKSLKNRKDKMRERKEAQVYWNYEQDDWFYYIAGYTSGGVPYGITWEEMGLNPGEEMKK